MKPAELILIVEDDEAIGKLLLISLKEYGYKTHLAQDIVTAKREFITHNPSLIILDLGLPDGDGKSLISTIRKESKTMRGRLLTPLIWGRMIMLKNHFRLVSFLLVFARL